jgi:hypothetical protein
VFVALSALLKLTALTSPATSLSMTVFRDVDVFHGADELHSMIGELNNYAGRWMLLNYDKQGRCKSHISVFSLHARSCSLYNEAI